MGRAVIGLGLVLALGAAPAATAAGPKPVGGEGREIVYKQKLSKGRYFELRALPNGQITWLEVDAKWTCPAQHYVRLKPFLADGKPRIGTGRRLRATDSYDKGRWTLRFSPDWSRVSGSFSARLRDCRTGVIKVSGRRVKPAHPYVLGHYAGTTSQGLPVSFDATYTVRYGFIEWPVKNVVVGVRLTCTDGTTLERTLRSDMEGSVSQDTGSVYASVNESGRLTPDIYALSGTVSGFISGATASGGVEASKMDPEGANCSTPDDVTFSIPRV